MPIIKPSNENSHNSDKEDRTMADKKMNELNLDQLENAVGGTKPKLPPLGAKEFGPTTEKSVFPAIGRHSIPTGNQAQPSTLDNIKSNLGNDQL